MSTESGRGTGGIAASSRLRHYEAGVASAGSPGSYSGFVGFMRYLLPVVALILLGLVVAWPLMTGREEGFRISFSEDAEIDGTLKMVKARYMGTDARNRPFTVTAKQASQPDGDSPIVHLRAIEADIFVDPARSEWLAVTADEGLYQRDARLLDLAGDVAVYSDSGHEFRTTAAHVDLPAGTAEGDQPVSGQGPYGLLDANSFTLKDRGQVMTFVGRVHMTVFPDARKRGDEGRD